MTLIAFGTGSMMASAMPPAPAQPRAQTTAAIVALSQAAPHAQIPPSASRATAHLHRLQFLPRLIHILHPRRRPWRRAIDGCHTRLVSACITSSRGTTSSLRRRSAHQEARVGALFPTHASLPTALALALELRAAMLTLTRSTTRATALRLHA